MMCRLSSFALLAIAYIFTLFGVFNVVLLSFDFLRLQMTCCLSFRLFMHCFRVFFSAFSLPAHVGVFRCWFKHHCVSYLQ